MASEPTDVEHIAEPITGWRAWDLTDRGPGLRLLPVSSDAGAWPPGRPQEARCEVPRLAGLLHSRHEAPDAGCRCGIYAARSLLDLERPRPAWLPPTAVGTVSLWGRIVEHELGWRAARAYPARLRLVCPMCAWFEPGPGTPASLHRFGRRLYALCPVHAAGIEVPDGRRSRPSELDPSDVQQSLLAAYGVELLPLEAVEALFRLPRTPDPPSYWPTIRVVRTR